MSYVYVIGPRLMDGAVKIGRSQEPVVRLAQLGPDCGGVLFTVSTKNATGAESMAHSLLAKHRLDGEWFAVTPNLAEDAVIRAVCICTMMPLTVPVTEWPPRLPSNYRELVVGLAL